MLVAVPKRYGRQLASNETLAVRASMSQHIFQVLQARHALGSHDELIAGNRCHKNKESGLYAFQRRDTRGSLEKCRN